MIDHFEIMMGLQKTVSTLDGKFSEFKDESNRQRGALFEKVDAQGQQLTELVAQVQNLVALAQNAASVPALAARMTSLEKDVEGMTSDCKACNVEGLKATVDEMKPKVQSLHEKEIGRKAVVGAAAVGGGAMATLIPHAWTAIKAYFQHHPPG